MILFEPMLRSALSSTILTNSQRTPCTRILAHFTLSLLYNEMTTHDMTTVILLLTSNLPKLINVIVARRVHQKIEEPREPKERRSCGECGLTLASKRSLDEHTRRLHLKVFE